MEKKPLKSVSKCRTGRLKSSPGFLKCMRSVYLFFKSEKEKGALNIPINSFLERTAVACGVGRGTLYNYAKKGLFDESTSHNSALLHQKKAKKRKERASESFEDKIDETGSSKKNVRSIEVQTDTITNARIVETRLKDVAKSDDHPVNGPWASGNSARRDIDYFTKANIWQNVYNINAQEICSSAELTPRMGNCQPTAADIPEL